MEKTLAYLLEQLTSLTLLANLLSPLNTETKAIIS